MSAGSSKADYGIDAPRVIVMLFLIGVVLVVASFKPRLTIGPVTFILGPGVLVAGAIVLLEAVLMVVYSRYGKFRHRDLMLQRVKWRGDEAVLDVGTGRGLMLIGAAKKLTTGKSVGIDIWSSKDLSGNSMQATLRNAAIEGVWDRVDVQDGDATALKFPNRSFDVVVSNLCIHNIPSQQGRDKACQEIVRVLKPGGKAIISDFIRTGRYAQIFKASGTEVERSGMNFLFTFPPLRIVEVRKPA
jgi:arsenite methyltransferase